MSRAGKILLVAFAAIGVLYIAQASFFIFFGSSRCLMSTAMIVASPSARHFAKIETESCAGESVHTRVALSNDRVSRTDSISHVVFDAAAPLQNADGSYSPVPISLAWLSDSEIRITHPQNVGVTSGDMEIDGIKVTFRNAELPGS